MIKKLLSLLEKSEKQKIVLLLLMSTVGAVFEMLGVSLTVPLMTAILQPSIVSENARIAGVCASLGIGDHRGFVMLCIASMIALFIVKDLFLIFKSRFTAHFVIESRLRMQKKMLRSFLRKPYEYYLRVSSGEIMRVIRTDVINAYAVLNTSLSLVSETIVSLAIVAVVVVIDSRMTLLIAAFVSLIMLAIIRIVKPILREEGAQYRKSASKAYSWILQSVHGIKEIKIGRRESFFEEHYGEAGQTQAEAEKRYSVLNSLPRTVIEMGCICAALAAMLVMIASGSDPSSLIPAFAAFAMAAVKLMPAFSRVVGYVNMISYHGPCIDRLIENVDALDEAEQPSDSAMPISLREKVELHDVTYRYDAASEPVLEHASMTVPAGHTVGISGISGAGKTTAVDVLLGLLKPEEGSVLCDGADVSANYAGWLELVAYIPQRIFMLDGSIRENVVFGRESGDDAQLWRVLEEAKLADFVRRQPMGLDTQIGERGIRLSGGQCQRIGIARALYGDPELLVFDEATSSLDSETEAAIMEAIGTLHGEKTVIIIAHRPETIRYCDIVYRVEDKKLVLTQPNVPDHSEN